jgi:hypothetical protein
MATVRGNFYYRSRRVNGQPRNEYLGAGMIGRLAADLDNLSRHERDEDRALLVQDEAAMDALDDLVRPVRALADDLARAAMVAAGYHRHHRGWRKKRVRKDG